LCGARIDDETTVGDDYYVVAAEADHQMRKAPQWHIAVTFNCNALKIILAESTLRGLIRE
jgi:hypothetical protein